MAFIKGIDEEADRSRSLFNTEKKLVFDPPVYEQRYLITSGILSHEKFSNRIKNVVEFGVAEMKFFVYMKNSLKHSSRIDLVDIDGDLLERFKSRIEPLIVEYLNKRERKLTARVWKGSVAVPNPNFKNVDAVVAIELIEHVFPDVLEEIPFHIFGIIKPKIVVLTTPNGDFNVLFEMKPGEFRHDDHKFEWTREEFEDWCNHICVRFPDYCVQFHGVGKAPEGFESLGCCSQLGFFIKKDFFASLDNDLPVDEEVASPEEDPLIECDDYNLIHSVTYPFFHDTRGKEEKLIDEVNYQVNRFRFMGDDYFNYEADRFEIPLKLLANCCWQVTDNIDEIRSVIKNVLKIENDFVILPPNESEHDHESEQELEAFEGQSPPKSPVYVSTSPPWPSP